MAELVWGTEVVELMPIQVVLQFSFTFIIIGFLRGVRVESWSTACILLTYLVLWVADETLITWTNRFYKLTRFGLAGGIVADNPVDIWQEYADDPPIIETENEQVLFRMTIFLALFLFGWIIARVRVQRALAPVNLGLIRELPDLGERALGAVLGGVNGYLIGYYVLPVIRPAETETIIIVPESDVITEFMTRNLANVGFVILVVIILLGLMASGGIRQRG